ncbi:NDMA-dependent alcohol dehydrogenase [Gordonia insulae]|uniref:alcohol dehydrogenase n=1 Tax=Gordonia insulae TaxID=2420509 RepID=A0A3G8JR04_9ACTN|nr:NDMA-dependent alcohol dehydrogenase [Gordonia insulae]AZG47155.1 Alcohol dehydrogenase B [Gordonia insulae]
METKAAVLRGIDEEWQIETVELADPVPGEVQVRLVASGMCHSDHHLRTGASPAPLPIVGGHEGAGVVTKVGAGVTGFAEGDHVVTAFIPACGTCRPCSSGLQNLCDEGARLLTGQAIADDGFRVTANGQPLGQMCLLGTFSPYITVHQASVVKIEKDIPLESAALLGCGVATGWGSATVAGGTTVGDSVVVVGCGGVGINAVQGAAAAGARHVIAVDPVAFKRDKAIEFGATHAFESMEEALEPVRELTWGTLADVTVITVGELEGDMIAPAMALTAKGGNVVVTGMGHFEDVAVTLSLFELTLLQKRLQGAIFGGTGPRTQIPALLNEYRSGALKLDELVTTTYKLEEINQGYADMLAGKNLRGVIRYTDADY